MQQMSDGVMPLNQFAPISVYRDAYRFAWLRRAPLNNGRAMNKNVAALLGIDDTQLTNFGPIMSRNVEQSPIADLTAHLCVEWRPINNDI